MNIEELIKQLEELKAKHGNINVCILQTDTSSLVGFDLKVVKEDNKPVVMIY
jgi:hypothetical protein